MKKGLLIKWAPQEIRTHLQIGSAVRQTYEQVRMSIETHMSMKGIWNLGDIGNDDPMDIGAVDRAKGKGKKGKGKGLAADGTCIRCGVNGCNGGICPHKDKVCSKCGKVGHLAKMCRSKGSCKGVKWNKGPDG